MKTKELNDQELDAIAAAGAQDPSKADQVVKSKTNDMAIDPSKIIVKPFDDVDDAVAQIRTEV